MNRRFAAEQLQTYSQRELSRTAAIVAVVEAIGRMIANLLALVGRKLFAVEGVHLFISALGVGLAIQFY